MLVIKKCLKFLEKNPKPLNTKKKKILQNLSFIQNYLPSFEQLGLTIALVFVFDLFLNNNCIKLIRILNFIL